MPNKKLTIVLVSFTLVLVVGYGAFLLCGYRDINKAGMFGDSFGVITSLFSGLAFVGIILTILLQRDELQLQRQELALTRDELKSQHTTARRQIFENTFFQMLRLHNDIVAGIRLPTKKANGRECFIHIYEGLQRHYNNYSQQPIDQERTALEEVYSQFWNEYQNQLGHYFRYLYTMFKFVKTSAIEDKRLYTNIIRAQLSDKELLVLFYNCLCKYGVEQFKPLAEEFAIFNNLPKEQLLKPKLHCDYYDQSAFGTSNR
jgi:hypothetical protein